MPWAPHVTVAVVVEQEGRFLLVEELARGDHPVFNQPAGHVERGETLMQAALREAREETGWELELTALLGFYVYTPPTQPDTTYYRACFIGNALRHHPERPLDEGILAAVWLTRDALLALGRARSPLVLRCIDDYLAGRRLPLDSIYEHGHD